MPSFYCDKSFPLIGADVVMATVAYPVSDKLMADHHYQQRREARRQPQKAHYARLSYVIGG
jgi:hypothetical protein